MHQQQVASASVRFSNAQRPCHRGRDEPVVAHGRQIHEKHAVRKTGLRCRGNSQRQPCLADTAWSRQGDQAPEPTVLFEEIRDDRGLLLAADERCRRERQLSGFA